MEDHSEVVTHGGRALEKKLVMFLTAGLLAGREPVEFLPDDGGAVRECGEAGEMRFDGFIAATQELPRLHRCDVIQIPAARGPLAAANPAARGQTTALRKARRLHPKSEAPEIVWLAGRERTLAPRSHRFPEAVLVHPAAIVGDCDDGTRAIPMEVDPDVPRPSGDAVVHEIGQRSGQFVTECAQAFREACWLRWDIIVTGVFVRFLNLGLEPSHAWTLEISIPLRCAATQ